MTCIDQIENFVDAKIKFAIAIAIKTKVDTAQLGRNVQIARNELQQCLIKS